MKRIMLTCPRIHREGSGSTETHAHYLPLTKSPQRELKTHEGFHIKIIFW